MGHYFAEMCPDGKKPERAATPMHEDPGCVALARAMAMPEKEKKRLLKAIKKLRTRWTPP